MAKITLDSVISGFKSVTRLVSNFSKIEDSLNNDVLWRDNPEGEPNQMEDDLDMNTNRITNLPSPVNDTDAVRWVDVKDGVTGVNEVVPSQSGNEKVALTTNGTSLVFGAVDSDNVDFLQAGTGAVATDVQSKLRESVSVKDFGAVGDGVTDDTAAFVAAFSASRLVHGSPDSTYLLDEVTLTNARQVFDGKGCVITPKAGSKYALRLTGYHRQICNVRPQDPNGNCVGATTLSSNAAAGATSILVADGSKAAVEDQVYIFNDNNRWNRSRVTNVSGTTITLSDGIDVDSTSGDKVYFTKGVIFIDEAGFPQLHNIFAENVWSGVYLWGSGASPNNCFKGLLSNVRIQNVVLAGISVAGNVHDFQWSNIEIWGGVSQTETFSGNGALTTFALEYPVWRDSDQDITVVVDSVTQTNPADYTHTDEMTINFNTPPSSSTDNIVITRFRPAARGIVFDSRGVVGAFGADGMHNVYVLGVQTGIECRRSRLLATGVMVDSCQDEAIWIDDTDRSFFHGCSFLFARTSIRVTGSTGGAENVRFSGLRTTFITAASDGLLGTEIAAAVDIDSGANITIDYPTWWGVDRGLTGAGTVRFTVDQYFGRADKTASEPAFSFQDDSDTGLFSPGANQLGLGVGGTRRVYVDSSGDVGVGDTYSPSYKFDVNGDINSQTQIRVNGTVVVNDRVTGWTAPTGTTDRGTFDTSTVTTEELAERVKALVDDLTAHGLIGS